jgi:hypothetical protein
MVTKGVWRCPTKIAALLGAAVLFLSQEAKAQENLGDEIAAPHFQLAMFEAFSVPR